MNMKIALNVLTLNEEPRIKECLEYHKPFVDYIFVLDGGSTDRTVEIAQEIADRVVIRLPHGDYADDRNYAFNQTPPEYEWVLAVDADERFHIRFLQLMRDIIDSTLKAHPEAVAFRFPRANLPRANDFPDYQTRLLKNDGSLEWENKVHAVPRLKGDTVAVQSRYGRCFTVLDCPIWHLPRRGDIERDWWNTEQFKEVFKDKNPVE